MKNEELRIKNVDELLEALAVEAAVNPAHYKNHPSGVEAIEVVESMPFLLGAACKYLFRLGKKDHPLHELKKAEWFLQRWLDMPFKKRPPLAENISDGQRRFLDWLRAVYCATLPDQIIGSIVWGACGAFSRNAHVRDSALRHSLNVLREMIADIEGKEGKGE